MSTLTLDAEALYVELLISVRALLRPETRLVGVTSGGVWLAERLQRDLGLSGRSGVISSSLHRDDYARRGHDGRRADANRFRHQRGADPAP